VIGKEEDKQTNRLIS